MNRIQEKVKDLIEVRKYEHLHDFLAEPSKTLIGYHYTPGTSELMVNWLDALTQVEKGSGVAKALAGYRGVGKSHFLATLGAMLANPELRAETKDEHVLNALQHLRRRHYPVAHVRRGTKKTFTEELITAISLTLSLDPNDIESNIEKLIQTAAENAGELPFVILIDTDIERDARVSRDDGILLGQLAEVAKEHNVFLGVALDDDITDADGINAAIAGTYTIDYLDQEHLYQIVDSHIFPKQAQALGVIQKLYNEFRSTLPNFRWSEQRFNSLYPLHPSILEVAPYIRFYAPNFALLGFASKAGTRILGRPANSLISLDEVFDSVEGTLRKSAELEDSFTIYDKILDEVISEIPVMQRLQSKLILKALFILSLDGNGTTPGEIGEALLIYDDASPDKGVGAIEELLEAFSSKLPDEVYRKVEEGRETRYSIKVSAKDDLNIALEEAAAEVSLELIPNVLRRLGKDRFTDWKLFNEPDSDPVDSMISKFLWRGSFRRASVNWGWDGAAIASESENEDLDIRVLITDSAVQPNSPKDADGFLDATWNVADLNGEETETLQRLYVLLNDISLKDEYGEQVRAAGHTHLVAAKKIWERVFLTDARFEVDGEPLEFGDNAAGADTLSEVLSGLLKEFYDDQYPDHPIFEKPLGMKAVSTLVNDLFSGARGNLAGVQELADLYALPLGLATLKNDEYVLDDEEQILELPIIQKLISIIDGCKDETVSLGEIHRALGEKPYGLGFEGQNLILAALVAHRKLEFVTSTDDRINHRSLDLKIIWEDIVGVAEPTDVLFDYEVLSGWVRAISGDADLESFNGKQGRAEAVGALSSWLDKWDEEGAIEKFNELTDEILNTKIWHVSTRVEKSFGAAARTVRSIVDENVSLEDGLQRIAETFFDSELELGERKRDLQVLEDFIAGAVRRERIWSYLAVCEATQDENIETFRAQLLRLIDESYDLPSFDRIQDMDEIWGSFRDRYSEHFAVRHNAIMNSQQLKKEFDQILKTDEWWEFECLSKLPIFKDLHWQKAKRILKRFRELDCGFDVKENLKSHPFCACAFSLTKMGELAKLSHSLSQTIDVGRESYRRTLRLISDFIISAVEKTVEKDDDAKFQNEADKLIGLLKNKSPEPFTSAQLSILHAAMFSVSTSTSIDIDFPDESGLYTSEELRARLNAWFDDLPNEPILLKI